jgi:hypothetical protein
MKNYGIGLRDHLVLAQTKNHELKQKMSRTTAPIVMIARRITSEKQFHWEGDRRTTIMLKATQLRAT